MQTIYTYNENISNLIILLFCIISLGALLFLSILFLPLLKNAFKFIVDLIKQHNKHFVKNITKNQILICVVTLTIYVILMVAIWFMSRLTLEARFKWIDTDISNCKVVFGNIERFDYKVEEHRDTQIYYCDILIENKLFKNFYLGMENKNVVSELVQNQKFAIYYQEYDDDLFIVKIDKVQSQSEESSLIDR